MKKYMIFNKLLTKNPYQNGKGTLIMKKLNYI